MNEQTSLSEYQNMHLINHKLEPINRDSQTIAFYCLKPQCAPESVRESVSNEAALALPGDSTAGAGLASFVCHTKKVMPAHRAVGTGCQGIAEHLVQAQPHGRSSVSDRTAGGNLL